VSLNTADYDYFLPEELIARYPTERRDESRLMILDRRSATVTHHLFRHFGSVVDPQDLIVLNNTRVIPARIRFPGRNAEILLIEQSGSTTWRCLVRPGKWFTVGRRFDLPGFRGQITGILADGDRIIELDQPVDFDLVGEIPLPPYLGRPAEKVDEDRYQTIYASEPGAIAAPTAGLHFTSEILQNFPHEFITLHVGIGTFKPVKVDLLIDHQMHREHFEVRASVADHINEAKRVLAVGTTTVRTLESLMLRDGKISPGRGDTDLFIYPPFTFRRVTSLLTNFHLPRSTLLMLVSAFAGQELTREAYREAIRERYRFFSYGDCMLIK
jgi:S-adenosylmethionine:tRNA ribosyltransferase-isomerase